MTIKLTSHGEAPVSTRLPSRKGPLSEHSEPQSPRLRGLLTVEGDEPVQIAPTQAGSLGLLEEQSVLRAAPGSWELGGVGSSGSAGLFGASLSSAPGEWSLSLYSCNE